MRNDCDRVSKIESELRNFYSALPQLMEDVEKCVKGKTYGPGILEAMRGTQANMEDNIARMRMHASVERERAGEELEAWRDQISSLETNVKILQQPHALRKVDVMLIIKACRLVQAALEMDAESIKNFKVTNEMEAEPAKNLKAIDKMETGPVKGLKVTVGIEAEKIKILNASLSIMETSVQSVFLQGGMKTCLVFNGAACSLQGHFNLRDIYRKFYRICPT